MPRCSVTPRRFCSSPRRMRTISRSMCGRSVVRPSMRCTSTPSAAKIDAYSQPMTPAPTTAIDCGMVAMCRIVSLSQIASSSNGTSIGRYGEEPVAMRMTLPSSTVEPDRGHDLDLSRRLETRVADVAIDFVPAQVLFDALPLALDDEVLAMHELGDADVALDLHLDRAARGIRAGGSRRDGAPTRAASSTESCRC